MPSDIYNIIIDCNLFVLNYEVTTDWSNFGEPEDTFVHYVREGQIQPEVADGMRE